MSTTTTTTATSVSSIATTMDMNARRITVVLKDNTIDDWGNTIDFNNKLWKVVVYSGKQSDRLGIKNGDIIFSRNGETITDENRDVIQEKLMKRHACKITLLRPNNIIVVFKPGKMGMTYSGNTVTDIIPNEQADRLGIRKGWKILEINGISQPNEHSLICKAIDKTYQAGKSTEICFQLDEESKVKEKEDDNANQKTNIVMETKENAQYAVISHRWTKGFHMEKLAEGEDPNTFFQKQSKMFCSVMFVSYNKGNSWSIYKKHGVGAIDKILKVQSAYLPSPSEVKDFSPPTSDMLKSNTIDVLRQQVKSHNTSKRTADISALSEDEVTVTPKLTQRITQIPSSMPTFSPMIGADRRITDPEEEKVTKVVIWCRTPEVIAAGYHLKTVIKMETKVSIQSLLNKAVTFFQKKHIIDQCHLEEFAISQVNSNIPIPNTYTLEPVINTRRMEFWLIKLPHLIVIVWCRLEKALNHGMEMKITVRVESNTTVQMLVDKAVSIFKKKRFIIPNSTQTFVLRYKGSDTNLPNDNILDVERKSGKPKEYCLTESSEEAQLAGEAQLSKDSQNELHNSEKKSHIVENAKKCKVVDKVSIQADNKTSGENSKKGQLDVVQDLLKLQKHLAKSTKEKGGALVRACNDKNIKVVRELIATKASVNESIQSGWTPLLVACNNNHIAIVKSLIKAQASLDQVTKSGVSPLTIACHENYMKIVTELIGRKASLNQPIENGDTPLMIAIGTGHTHVVTELITGKADLDNYDKNGKTALYLASQEGHIDVVVQLCEAKANLNVSNSDGGTPLFSACEEGRLDIVQALIKFKANLDISLKNGCTALFRSCHDGDFNIVKELLNAKADIEKTLENGCTPLLRSCHDNHLNIVKALLKSKANVEKSHQNGWTPLFRSCYDGKFDIVKELLNSKANINTSLPDGQTPLFVASRKGHLAIVQELIKLNADLEKSSHESTPFFLACEQGHLNVIRELVKAKAQLNKSRSDGWTQLLKLSYSGNLLLVKELLRGNADIEKPLLDGRSPLFIAAQKGHLDVVIELLKSKSSVDKSENNKITPLYIACDKSHPTVVHQLLRYKADPNRFEGMQWTPLALSCHKNRIDIVKHLIAAKACINQQTEDGKTPLSLAQAHGHQNIIKYLLEGKTKNI